MAPLLIFAVICSLTITNAEDRSHGLENESPVAFSPEAYGFFHPNALQPSATGPCNPSDCSTFPMAAAATVESTPAHESTSMRNRGLGAGSILAILAGCLFVGITALGVYYVVTHRRANLKRGNPERQVVV